MKLNASDGCKRNYILVQLPELYEKQAVAYKEGYRTLCEVAEERIRRAGNNIKNELEKENMQLKLGEGQKRTT